MIEAKIRDSSRQILLPSPSKVTFNGGFSGKKLDSSKRSLSIFKNPYSLYQVTASMWASTKKPSRDISAHNHWGRYSDKDDNLIAKKINSKKLNSHRPSHSSVSMILGDLGELSYFEWRHCICSLQAPGPEQHDEGGPGGIEPLQ